MYKIKFHSINIKGHAMTRNLPLWMSYLLDKKTKGENDKTASKYFWQAKRKFSHINATVMMLLSYHCNSEGSA
jgi:hypothetical protein